MIIIKTSEEIELIRESCLLVSNALAVVSEYIRPGITGLRLDNIAEEFIRDHGGVPSFKGYRKFPNSLCISKNHEVVHGIPDNYEYRDGDILSIDCGVYKNEFHGDSAYTFSIGEIKEETRKLMQITMEALMLGIEQATTGKRLGDIGFAVQNLCERTHKYGVVRDLVGHGLGRELHEEPEVPNYGRRGNGMKLQENMVIAIEPMVNLGTRKVQTNDDGWTVITKDKKPSAHYEHSVVVKSGQAEILTTFEYIREALKKNEEIKEIA